MGHSKADKARSRERIVAAAARQLREGGIDGVRIGELMREAGLTHGGFYGHFPSRAALIAAALERALDDGETAAKAARGGLPPSSLKAILNSYLSPVHRDHADTGCAISALAGDVARADPEVRAIMMRRLEQYFGTMATTLGSGPEAEAAALSTWCTMVGALVLSRVFKGEEMGDLILLQARKALLKQAGSLESMPR